MGKPLVNELMSAALVEDFATHGAVCVRGALSKELLDRLVESFESLKLQAVDTSDYYGHEAKGQTLVRNNNWQSDPSILNFIQRSPIADIAREVLQSRSLRLYEDLLIYKEAGTDQPTPWHQDDPRWPLTGRQMCSVWMCLEPVTLATGALRFAAGSSNGPPYEPYLSPAEKDNWEPMEGGAFPDVDADPKRFPVLSFDTLPGDIVVFHSRSIHAAFGSARERPRRTFSFRFIGDDVRWKFRKNVFYDFLRTLPLKDGDTPDHPRFPLVRNSIPTLEGVPA